MRTYTEEQVIAILDHIERNGFNDDCMTMNEELDYLNNIGVVKNCSIPDVVGQSKQLKALEDLKDFAYDNCQLHNNDRLAEIMERL